jgi:hypothetical protein
MEQVFASSDKVSLYSTISLNISLTKIGVMVASSFPTILSALEISACEGSADKKQMVFLYQ